MRVLESKTFLARNLHRVSESKKTGAVEGATGPSGGAGARHRAGRAAAITAARGAGRPKEARGGASRSSRAGWQVVGASQHFI